MNTPLVFIGDRLGLYRAMADGEPVTAAETPFNLVFEVRP